MDEEALVEPLEAELTELHTALVAGEDPTVPARLAEKLVPLLEQRFRSKSGTDVHSVSSLVGLSVARYLAEPHRFKPERGPLLAYLYRDVHGDLKNEMSSHTALRRHEIPDSDTVELGALDRNLDMEEEAVDQLDRFDVPTAVLEEARAEAANFSVQDQELLRLLGDGVRESAPYAAVLGICHLLPAAQRMEVKRHKDRLKARVEVIRGRLDRST